MSLLQSIEHALWGSFLLLSFCGFVIDHNAIKIFSPRGCQCLSTIAGLKLLGSKKEISLKICFFQLDSGTKHEES